jgi:hypothetical protein
MQALYLSRSVCVILAEVITPIPASPVEEGTSQLWSFWFPIRQFRHESNIAAHPQFFLVRMEKCTGTLFRPSDNTLMHPEPGFSLRALKARLGEVATRDVVRPYIGPPPKTMLQAKCFSSEQIIELRSLSVIGSPSHAVCSFYWLQWLSVRSLLRLHHPSGQELRAERSHHLL